MMIGKLISQRLNQCQWKNLFDKLNFFETHFDPQFKSIYKVISKYPEYKNHILFAIIQNSLISYQLSWTWENRWEEFANFLIDNFDIFLSNNCLFWQKCLKTCKYNRRFVEKKLIRIKKSSDLYKIIKNNWQNLYQNMIELNKILAKTMQQNINSKTIVFAVKMFWYGARINYKFIPYPFEIDIPIDSRITKIYLKITWKEKATKKEILDYFRNLSKTYNIPPLHLDSLLWIKM
jgi:DNA-(apurinic or apyrimidinic site) lyase